jgi:hypothetical protein
MATSTSILSAPSASSVLACISLTGSLASSSSSAGIASPALRRISTRLAIRWIVAVYLVSFVYLLRAPTPKHAFHGK